MKTLTRPKYVLGLLSLMVLLVYDTQAQSYVMGTSPATNGSTLTACNGVIYDDGGISSDYSNNQDITVTITASADHEVLLDFGVFNFRNSDYLYVYDGTSTSAPQVTGSPFTGSTIPLNIISTSGSLTLREVTNGSQTRDGFEAAFLCVPKSSLGYAYFTWDNATSGSQTVISTSGSAGAPPDTITDQITGCPSNGSIPSFDVDIILTEVTGNVYDRMRSGTDGPYGQPYFTFYMDNYDNGVSPNTPYSPGDAIQMKINFEHALQIRGLVISDLDASNASPAPGGSSAFQDEVEIIGLGLANDTVPVTVELMKSGTLTLNGQTATAGWTSGVSNDIHPDSLRGSIHVTSASPLSSLIIIYRAGPQESNPAQQGVRLGPIDLLCPVILEISGNVYDDGNGLNDSTVNGAGIGTASGSQLYVNLIDSITGLVVNTVAVNSNGTYTFTDITGDYSYILQLSTVQGTVGASMPTSSLPSNWVATGENIGAGVGYDSAVDQINYLQTQISDVFNINFGIDEIPIADSQSYVILSPTLNDTMVLGSFGSGTGWLSGTDQEDGSKGHSSKMAITSLPNNGNELWYDGVQITVGADGINPPSPTNPFIFNYDSSLLVIKFTGIGTTDTYFDYTVYDSACVPSAPVQYYIEWAIVLPVEFLYLEAEYQLPSSSLINWATASEANNDYFIVERSYNAADYEPIGEIDGKGNSQELNSYTYMDLNLNNTHQDIYYRIKQIDFDGSIAYSPIAVVSPIPEVEIYPNPAKSFIEIKGYNSRAISADDIVLTDINGKIVEQVKITLNQSIHINLSELATGVYYCTIHTGHSSQTYKVLKY